MTIRVRRDGDTSATSTDNEDTDLLSTASSAESSDEVGALSCSLDDYATTSEFVEPVQLQVVCQNLWNSLDQDDVEITAAHLESRGDVNEALARFYEGCVTEASVTGDVREGVIRRWFGEQLITPSGTRGLVLRRGDRTGGLPNQAVNVLEARHIIRGEDRGGARWFELSHDRFIEPIVSSNLRWQWTRPNQALWSELVERATRWDTAPAGQKHALLLDKAGLARAEDWKNNPDAEELGISDRLQRFLAESRDAIERAEFEDDRRAERNKFRRLFRGTAALVALLTLAVGGWCYAWVSQRAAERSAHEAADQANLAKEKENLAENQRNLAEVNQFAMKAAVATQPKDALGHIHQALDQAEKNLDRTIATETQRVIRKRLSQINHRSLLGSYADEVTEVVFAKGQWKDDPTEYHPVVAVGGRDGYVDLWDLRDYNNPHDDERLATIRPKLPSPGEKAQGISRIVFAPKGLHGIAFATGDPSSVTPEDRGSAWIWTESMSPDSEHNPLRLGSDDATGPVADIAFSPDGGLVATAGRRKLVRAGDPDVDGIWGGIVNIYEVSTGKSLDDFTLKGPAQSVAFDRQGERLVVASGDRNGNNPNLPGQVVVYALKTREATVMQGCEHPSVRALFSPDGRVVVSGGVDGIGRVHNPKDGRLIATLAGHTQPISAINFNPDGTRLVTASGDRRARIWDPASWSGSGDGAVAASWPSRVTLVGHTASLLWAEFSPDGTLVLTCSYDRTARVWDAQTGECLVTQVGHEGTVNMARFSGRGFLMATAGSDRTARIWTTGNVEAARRPLARRDSTTTDSPGLRTPGGHEAALRGVAFSPRLGSDLVLTAGADGVAYPWDISGPDAVAPAKPLPPFEAESPGAALTDLAISPDGQEFATAGLDGKVRVWRLEREARTKPKVITANLAKAGAALGVTFSPKGTYLLTSWADGRMRLFRRDWDDWNPVTDWPGSALRLTPQLFDPKERFVVTPNAGLLRVKGDQGSVSLWEVSNAGEPTRKWTRSADGPVSDLAIHPQDRTIAAATMGLSGTVVVWDDAGHRTRTWLRHPSGVERLTFSPDGRALATEAEDGLGRIWDWPCEGGPPRKTLVGLTGPSPMLAFSADSSHLISDGGYLATDGASTVGQIWDRSQKTAIPLRGPRDRVVTLAFNRVGDEHEVLSINRENQLQRWSIEKGDPRGSCRGPSLAPTAAAIQPGVALAASGTDNGTLKVWRTETGEEVAADLKEHKKRINSLAFSDDGRRLVSAGNDGLACVWAVPERDTRSSAGLKLVARLEHKDQQVSVARFLDREGQRVVTGTGDLKRTRWPLEPGLRGEAKVCRLDSVNPVADPLPVDALHDLKIGNLSVDAAMGVVTAAVSPADGRVFLGCGGPESRFNLVWSPASNHDKLNSQSYFGHTEPILDVAVSPDGQRLATASADNTARVWTIGKPADVPVELRGHSGDLASVTFSPDSRYVLTISRQDGTARVWDRDGGDALYVLGTRRAGLNSATLNDPAGPRQYTDDVVAAAFSPDGKWVVTASGDGTARAYRLSLCGDFDDLKGVADYRREGFWPEGKAHGSSER
jgi:WD40 repeat protein